MARGEVVNAADRIAQKYGSDRMQKFKKEKLISISSGSILFDQALGKFKGYPEGAIIESFGWEGSGKTLMLFIAIAEAQKKFPDRPCAIIDAEKQFKYQSEWAESFGIDVEKLEVIEVSSAEEGFDIMSMMILGDVELDKDKNVKKIINPGNYSIIGIDSISQLVPLEEVHKDMDESTRIGSQAAAIGRGFRKVVSAMINARSKTILFCTNQLRENPNAMFSNPVYRTGGNSLRFYNVIAFEIKRVKKSEIIDEHNKIIGHRVKIKLDKSKISTKSQEWIEFTINYDGTGVDNDLELFDVAIANDIIFSPKQGTYAVTLDPTASEKKINEKYSTFKCNKADISRSFKQYLKENPKVRKMIMSYIEEGQFYKKDKKDEDEKS